MQSPRPFIMTIGLLAFSGGLLSCSSDGSSTKSVSPAPAIAALPPVTPISLPTLADTKPLNFPGIHNAVAYHDGFISGSVPEGDEGYETLRAMGIKTIISVDGMEPEVAVASAHGLKYIHLPIGYNGFNEERKLQLVRATRDAMLDGPVYIHCHHGKHRSAGAAAAIATSLGWQTPDQGVARMKVSGTAPNYNGLFACAAESTVLGSSIIDAVPANFPAVWKPSDYVKGMTEIDETFDHLKAIDKAAWQTPKDHPDLVPVAEAGRLADLYRILHKDEYITRKPADLAAMMGEAHTRAQKLEDLLAAGEKDTTKLTAQLKLIGTSCTDCHAKYRDQ
jgi:protein tyrosine phosphatase (PTP) superfamily phosphohydrolase (DUF442 family)